MEWLDGIWNTVKEYIPVVTGIITAATGATALTPTRTKNKTVNLLLRIVNVVAGNFWKNKNADDKPKGDIE